MDFNRTMLIQNLPHIKKCFPIIYFIILVTTIIIILQKLIQRKEILFFKFGVLIETLSKSSA